MPTNVVMPQMGESIAEGTIVRWIKKVGDQVDRDEPLFEISTDKVDAEIPSPAAGVLADIKVKEGETVPVNSVVAVIGAAGDVKTSTATKGANGDRAAGASAAPAPQTSQMPEAAVGQPEVPVGRSGEEDEEEDDVADTGEPSRDDLLRRKSSPLVRRIAKEHNVDIKLVKGTGVSGRVTKNDILGYIESGAQARQTPAPSAPQTAPAPSAPQAAPAQSAPQAASAPMARQAGSAPSAAQAPPPPVAPEGGHVFKPGESVQIVPMSVMRKKIAEHMVLSAHTSPHVYSVYEVNFGRVSVLREQYKGRYQTSGAKLTYTAFVAKVIIDALRQFPIVNASVDGDKIIYKKDINLGIAVALDNGLIVPVIRNADEKNMLGLSRAIDDLAVRARSKKLNPEEVQAGTFTITNPGVFGALYGLPLINQPQVAILGVGAIEKRAVVIDDAIGIRPMCHLTLGYDHRLIDGADAGRFLSHVKEKIEQFEEGWM
jgi:pyruvate dehydrogenase E2 component (dihydrolipoyllysine-residue acetyltransferase)